MVISRHLRFPSKAQVPFLFGILYSNVVVSHPTLFPLDCPMRYFRLPLIVTGIAFVVFLILGITGMVMIDRTARNDQEKLARGTLLGQGLGTLFSFVVAPFWIYGAAKMGKDRRVALAEQNSKVIKKPKKKKESE